VLMVVSVCFVSILTGVLAERFLANREDAKAEAAREPAGAGDDRNQLLSDIAEMQRRLARMEAAIQSRRPGED
jgi:hypothetical protein